MWASRFGLSCYCIAHAPVTIPNPLYKKHLVRFAQYLKKLGCSGKWLTYRGIIMRKRSADAGRQPVHWHGGVTVVVIEQGECPTPVKIAMRFTYTCVGVWCLNSALPDLAQPAHWTQHAQSWPAFLPCGLRTQSFYVHAWHCSQLW